MPCGEIVGWDRLQRHHLAPSLRAGGDAVGDRTHPQRVQAIVAAGTFGEEVRFVFAFEPAVARQMPAHAIGDLVRQLRQLFGGRGAGAMQARFALRLFEVLIHAVEHQHVTNRQDSRFARPQVARRVAHRDVRHESAH